jgi:hypothetical protein
VELIAPKMKIREMKANITIWPAIMFAKRRMINAPGLITKSPKISTGTKINLTRKGTSGGQRMCFQKWPVVLKRITTSEINPSIKVNAMLPATLAAPGIIPNNALIRMKKNTVRR